MKLRRAGVSCSSTPCRGLGRWRMTPLLTARCGRVRGLLLSLGPPPRPFSAPLRGRHPRCPRGEAPAEAAEEEAGAEEGGEGLAAPVAASATAVAHSVERICGFALPIARLLMEPPRKLALRDDPFSRSGRVEELERLRWLRGVGDFGGFRLFHGYLNSTPTRQAFLSETERPFTPLRRCGKTSCQNARFSPEGATDDA